MHLALRENKLNCLNSPSSFIPLISPPVPAHQPSRPLCKPCSTEQQSPEYLQTEREQGFTLNITERINPSEKQTRSIKKSMINRSCINTLNFCYKSLSSIPAELTEVSSKLAQIQKLDLSFNTLADIHDIRFSKLVSLKELVLNDNVITELPFSEINQCKGLKLINLNNNQLYILPTLYRVSYLEAKNNPLRLVTSELVRLPQLEFAVFDWLDYLIQTSNHSINSNGKNERRSSGIDDKFKVYCQQFSTLKQTILSRIDYQKQQNMNYCDFHSYFSAKLSHQPSKALTSQYLSTLIVKSIYKSDDFFITYLHNFQNELNYATMMHNYKLLLETALDNSSKQVLELFRLKKDNYIHVNQEVYFESVSLCCRYSNYQMFRHLLGIKPQKQKIQTGVYLSLLIQEIIEKFDKDKESDKILGELVRLYREVSIGPVIIKMPEEYNSKVYKSLSLALLEIKMNQELARCFEIEAGEGRPSPLFFAMKSKNQELLGQFLKEDWNVFEANQSGQSCKYTYGSTQISRKMIWKKEKIMIKQHFQKHRHPPSLPAAHPNQLTTERGSTSLKSNIDKDDIAEEFDAFNSPEKSGMGLNLNSVVRNNRGRGSRDVLKKCLIQDEVLPYLFIRSKQITNCSWRRSYGKKMEKTLSFISILQQLTDYKDNSLLKRLQLWKKIMQRIVYLFDTFDEETPLLQYELVHISELMNATRVDKSDTNIKIESHRIGDGKERDSFWCCKNVGYDQ